jgi:hypothetical protein
MPTKLDEAFQVTIDRIRRQTLAKSSQGMEILQWTFLAERQLTVAEIRHALAGKHTSGNSLDLNDLPFERSLTDCCYGLVVVDKETSSIRLVRKSLQDFLPLQFDNRQLFQGGHCEIARTCLIYLSFNDNIAEESLLDITKDIKTLALWNPGFNTYPGRRSSFSRIYNISERSLRTDSYPFLKYAVHHWGNHVRKQDDLDPIVKHLAVELLTKNDKSCCI